MSGHTADPTEPRPRRSERYFAWLLTRRALVLAAAGGITVAALIGASRVRVDVDVEQFIPSWGAARATYDDYKLAFSKEDTRFSAFWRSRHSPGEALYGELERIATQFEEVGLEDVQWIGGVTVADQVELDGERTLSIHPLVDVDSLSDDYVLRTLERHRDDALYTGYLWNADQTAFGVHGYLPEARNEDRQRREAEAALTARLDSLDLDGASIALSGIPLLRSRSPRLLQADILVFLGGGLILAFALLWIAFRRVRLVLLSLASVVPGYLCTLGVMGLLDKPITMLTSFIPIVVLVVGVSDSIHIVQHFRSLRPEASNSDAAVAALGDMAMPCFYTSITTAVGFLSLAGTGIGIVVDFGLFTALAILLTYAFSMTALPVLLAGSRSAAVADTSVSALSVLSGIANAAARRARRPSAGIAAAFGLVGLACIVGAAGLRENTFMVDDYKESSEIMRDLRWIEASGFGLFQINVFLEQDGETPLHDPSMLRWMDDLQKTVSADPVVTAAVGPPELFKQLRGAFLEGSDDDRTIPESSDEAGQLLFLASLEDDGFADDVYRQHDGVAQSMFTVRDAGSERIQPILRRIDRYIEANPPPVGKATTTGLVTMVSDFTARLLRSFGPSLALTVILIFAIMVVMLKSVPRALLALIPNFFPLLVLLGVMRLGGFDLKPSTILVFSIAFGLAVDDTIHLLGRLRGALDRGADLTEALDESLAGAGATVLLTSTLIVAGFSLLMLSQFEVLFLIGMLTAVSALAAVTADLLLLPLVLRAADALGRRASRALPLVALAGLGAVAAPGSTAALSAQEATAEARRGRAIAVEAEARDRGWHDFSARLTMVLRDADGDERTRELRTSTLEGTDDGDKTLVVFDSPSDLQGTTLLTHSHHDRSDDQWIYLPAFKRVKRVASGSQSSSFMGSEFAYEDIGAQGVDRYRYRYVREEALDGLDSFVVERRPVDPASGYGRQVMWVDSLEYRVLRIDYYDRKDQPLKTLRVRNYRRYEDRHWRPAEMHMRNHATGKSTTLIWRDLVFEDGLTERDFARGALGRAR
ncbi:MAG: outer membrane lipoprotein-sorting protein [Gemmatimonadota bacterium]